MSHAIDQFLDSLSRSNVFDHDSQPEESDVRSLISDGEAVVQDALAGIGSLFEMQSAMAMAGSLWNEIPDDDQNNIFDVIRMLAQLAQSASRIQDEAQSKRRRGSVQAVA